MKDDLKQEALFEATVKRVNEIGFAASSVSKIAQEANVSPATIYVYYKDKEDLLVSTYIRIKQHMSEAVLSDLDTDQPIRDIMRKAWLNLFEYTSNYPDYFQYAEQFANTPFIELVDAAEVEKYFDPLLNILHRGIEEKIIKNVNFDILSAFVFYPPIFLSNSRLCKNLDLSRENIEIAFTLAWDAIKL